MLSEAEQRRLAAIEDRLRLDDPEFVYRFTVEPPSRHTDGWRELAAIIAFLVAVTAAGAGLYVLSAIGAVVSAIITVRLWTLYRHR
ncbi:DUF3040 domain-containing protein [Plantactinospora veratri]|uniref:DUF3040 domain-containing protein n=1 Tax=Plantactinospora veratri TaxID=1436122 RepID=A0ABU7SGP7_9ACTN